MEFSGKKFRERNIGEKLVEKVRKFSFETFYEYQLPEWKIFRKVKKKK